LEIKIRFSTCSDNKRKVFYVWHKRRRKISDARAQGAKTPDGILANKKKREQSVEKGFFGAGWKIKIYIFNKRVMALFLPVKMSGKFLGVAVVLQQR
jgi:hypothetical protein